MLSGLPHLRDLELYGCPVLTDISILATLTSLRTLTVQGSAVSDISALPALTELTLRDVSMTLDLSPLSRLPLQILRLGGLGSRPLQPLAALRQLTELTLDDVALAHLRWLPTPALRTLAISDAVVGSLDGIEAQKGLRTLSLVDCTRLDDLSPLAALSSLASLTIQACPQLDDLSVLQGMVGLKQLTLASRYVSSLDSLPPGCEIIWRQ